MFLSLSSMTAVLVAATAIPFAAPMKEGRSSSTPAGNAATAACDVRGVWELISGKQDGVAYPATLHQYKFITQTRFAWVSKDDTGPRELTSVADTLLAFRTRGGATGTYQVQGTTYTETIEFGRLPQYEGKSLPFTCRVEGDRFYQSGKFPVLREGNTVREVMIEEVYRRVDQS